MELKIYLSDLAAYNNGVLHGEWCTLPMDSDELTDKLQEILEEGSKLSGFNEVHEEYFITDYEFDGPKLFDVGEYSSLSELNEKCELCADLDEDDQKKVEYLIDYVGFELEDALNKYDEVTIYENMHLRDVVEQYIEDTVDMSNIPDFIANNIDYDSIANDWEISGEYEEIEGDVYYFCNRC